MARLEPDTRKQLILESAVFLAQHCGYKTVRRDEISALAGCASSLVAHYFTSVKELQRVIMQYAVDNEDLNIIAQGLVANDPIALNAPQELKTLAANSLL